jgi:hypothetical protein
MHKVALISLALLRGRVVLYTAGTGLLWLVLLPLAVLGADNSSHEASEFRTLIEEAVLVAQTRTDPATQVWILEESAVLFARGGDYASADRTLGHLWVALDKVISRQPKTYQYLVAHKVRALLRMAQVAKENGVPHESERYARSASKIAEGDLNPFTRHRSLMELVEYYLANHDQQHAESNFRLALTAIARFPEDDQKKDFERALLFQRRARRELESNLNAAARATIHEAIEQVRQVNQAGFTRTHLPKIAELQARSGNNVEAMESLKEVFQLRQATMQTHDDDEARRMSERIKMQKVVDLARVAYGQAQAQDYGAAAQSLEQAVQAVKNIDEEIDSYRGVSWEQIGKVAAVLGKMELTMEAVEKTRNTSFGEDLYPAVFHMLLKNGQLDRARELAMSAEQISLLAMIQTEQGDDAGAVQTWERMNQLQWSSNEEVRSISRALARTRGVEQAVEWARHVKESDIWAVALLGISDILIP